MTPKFFGQYLLEQGILQRNQLMEAIKYQRSKTRKFGEIAVSRGYLTPDQVEKINQEQRKTDKLFGEIAVGKGLLDEKRVKEIITIQQNAHIYLGEAIVETGLLTRDRLERALEGFKKEQGDEPGDFVMPHGVDGCEEFIRSSMDITQKVFRRMMDVLIKFGRPEERTELTNHAFLSELQFKGDASHHYLLTVSMDIALEIARKAYKSPDMEYEIETVRDAVAEFVNVVCGNMTAWLLTRGVKMDINVPRTWEKSEMPGLKSSKGTRLIAYPAGATSGDISMGVVLK